MKILITEPEYFSEKVLSQLKEIGEVVAKRLNYNDLLEEVKDADVLLVRIETIVDKKILDNAKKLKLIASVTTGTDHINVEEAKKHGVKVFNPFGYATNATSEYTMSLILNLVRKVPWAFENFKDDKWERYKFLGSELNGKTLGIIGFGRIGSKVRKYAKAFGMNVVFLDPYVNKEILKEVEAEQVTSLDNLLKKSDVITLHTFLSKETENMISKEQFSKMKNNCVIVNASRGKVIDESALVNALESGEIAGAALDVFEQEPLPSSHKLMKYAKNHDNLLLTPHVAGSTKESLENAIKSVVDKILEEVKS